MESDVKTGLLILVLATALGFTLGLTLARESMLQDCQRMNMTRIGKYVFFCAPYDRATDKITGKLSRFKVSI